MPLLAAAGRGLLALMRGAGRVVSFGVPSGALALFARGGAAATLRQSAVIVTRCAVPVALVTAPIGMMMALQSYTLMHSFGIERLLGPMVSGTVVRELAPGFVAVAVAMQGGAGVAAELAVMRQNDELDALTAMGIDPRAAVVGPRILGMALTTLLLNVLGIVAGLLGATVLAVLMLHLPLPLLVESSQEAVGMVDLWVSELKSAFFGLVTGAVCATGGFFAEKGPSGVGQATNRAVVASVMLVLGCNYLCNIAIFGLRGGAP